MNRRFFRIRNALQRRAASAFSRDNLRWAAAGAGIGIGSLAAGSMLAGEGLAFLLPSGAVHFALLGATGSVLLRHNFLSARAATGAWKTVLLGAVLGTASGLLWVLLLSRLRLAEGKDLGSNLQLTTMILPFSGALLALWIRGRGPSPGLLHSILQAVATTWLVLFLLCLLLFGTSGHTTGGVNYSLSWMWDELWMTYFVVTAMIAYSAAILLPPMVALAVVLWFRSRPRGPVASSSPSEAPIAVVPEPPRGDDLLIPAAG